MVLVDSSIWVGYFKDGQHHTLEELLMEDLVVTNDIILSELIPSATLKGETDLIRGLESLHNQELDIDWIGLRKLQILNLKHGINKVGIPDLVIIQHALQHNFSLWTTDKHFYLMQKHIHINLYNS